MSRLKPDEPAAQQVPKHVYVLSYAHPLPDGHWAGMLIGVYSSLDELEKAKTRLLSRPTYRQFPDGFRVSGMQINVEYDNSEFFAFVGPPPPEGTVGR